MNEKKTKLTILIAEDSIMNQTIAKSLLQKLGHQADIVDNGIAAVEAAKEKTYDIIFMDTYMPQMNGTEAVPLIRKECENQPHIVAMSANMSPQDKERYLCCGMNDYVSKPLTMEAIRDVLSHLHEKSAYQIDEPAPTKEPTSLKDKLLKSFGNNENLLQKYLKNLQESTPDLLKQIEGALSAENLEQIQQLAHKLKGVLSYCQEETIQSLLSELEGTESTNEASSSLSSLKNQITKLNKKLFP